MISTIVDHLMKEIQLILTETNTVDVTREIHAAGKQQGFNDQQADRSQLDAIARAP